MGRPKGGTNKYWSAEEKYKIMTKLQYIDVGQTNALCTLDTIIRVTEGPGNLYSCKKCIFKDTVRHDV